MHDFREWCCKPGNNIGEKECNMGRFRGKSTKGLKLSRTKRITYVVKRKPCVLTPGSTPHSKRFKPLCSSRTTPSPFKRPKTPQKSSKKKKLLFASTPLSPEPTAKYACFKMPGEILRDLGCAEIPPQSDDYNGDDNDDCENENEEGSETVEDELKDSGTKELMSLLPSVVKEFQNHGKLDVLQKLFHLVEAKAFPMHNIAFLLWCDLVRWFDNSDTRQMRYSPECLQFFWVGKKLFGGRFVRFMSGMKSEAEILKGSKMLDPKNSKVNFACPSESILSTINPLGNELPVNYKPGLLEPVIELKANKDDKNNSYVLMLDGKKMKRGTDVDLLGFETGKTLKDRTEERDIQLDVLDQAISTVTAAQESTNVIHETSETMKASILDHLRCLLLLFSDVLRGLRKLRLQKQLGLSKLKDLGGDDWRRSKHAYAIDMLMTTLWRIDNVLDKTMSVQRCICKAGASINNAAHLFAETDVLDLNSQGNVRILKPPEELPTCSDPINTSIIKQRSDLWFDERKKMKVTGSSIFQAIGCDSLKRQKEHFEKVFNGIEPAAPSETQQKAMQHGSECEVHQVATMCGIIMPFLYPDLTFQEEGFYVKDGVLVSPDGSLRDKDDMPKYAFEGKAPMEKQYTTTLHDKVPDRYIPQTMYEKKALEADSTLYLSWTEKSCVLFKVIPDQELCDEIQQEINQLYFTERPKHATRVSNRAKRIKKELTKVSENCIFLGEFPSIKGRFNGHGDSDVDSVSPYLIQTATKDKNSLPFTYDELQRHLLLGQEIIKDSYEVQRVMASQVVVYLLADLDRFWKTEQPHAIPVLYFYRGYSLSMDIARKITESCKAACRSRGLDVTVSAADGEFVPLMVRGRDGCPLTQHQLAKDIWKETGKMTKVEIIQALLKESTETIITMEPIQSTNDQSGQKQRLLRFVCSTTGALAKIRTPIKGWTQSKDTAGKDKRKETTLPVTNEDEEVLSNTDNNGENEQTDAQEESDILPEVSQNDDLASNEIEENGNVLGRSGPNLIDLMEISSSLSSLNNQKWSRISVDMLAQYFQTADTLKRFTVKELNEVTKSVNSKQTDIKKLLKTGSLRKHELVNQLSELIADGSKIPEKRSQIKRNVPPLRRLAQRVVMGRSYPKRVLNVAYSNFVWCGKLRQWKQNAHVSDAITIHGLDKDYHPYYVPDRTELGDFEVFVYDKTHLGSNLRKAICLDRLHGVSKTAWQSVADGRPDILNPTLLEVSEDGKIIDQMKERLARNMLSRDVETQMRENGCFQEANFCEVVREGLYTADDAPGIPAVERCKKRMALIDWLDDGVKFGDFPPYGANIKGMSHILYEGLRSSSEAKLYLYALAKKGTYCVRAPNTLCSESFFSTMQEMDPWGQGILTADGVEKHISDFTTITALKMQENRSFHLKTKRDAAYPVPTLSCHGADPEETTLPTCSCREKRHIRCIVPKDHYFDTEDRARLKRREKPYRFSDLNQPQRGQQPIRSQYGYRIDESKVFASKRLGLNLYE